MTRTITRRVTEYEADTGKLRTVGNAGASARKSLDCQRGQVWVRGKAGDDCRAMADGSYLSGENPEWMHDRDIVKGTLVRLTQLPPDGEGEGESDVIFLEVLTEAEKDPPDESSTDGSQPRARTPRVSRAPSLAAGPKSRKADQLPLSFEYTAPDAPQPSREDLGTLENWELWLRWELRKSEPLGMLDIAEGEYRRLARLISEVIKRAGPKRSTGELARKYPTALSAFLVAHGTYGFRAGDFWGGVRSLTGGDGGGDWGMIFEATLAAYELPLFPGMGGFRFVTPILVHGGIPDYCLPDFFRAVLLPSVTQPRYEVLETQDLVDALLDRAEVKFFADKPVHHFLEHGGKTALDFLKRCRELASGYVDTGVIPDPESVGLPSRVVAAFGEWVGTQEPVDRVRNAGEHIRLRRPRVVLDPWADGVVLAFPRQDMLASFLNRRLRCTVTAGESQVAAFDLRIRYVGGELHSDEVRRRLPMPFDSITVCLMDGTEPVRRWNLRLGGIDSPLLAFDPSTGELVAWDLTLPADRLWLLHPANYALGETVPCLERFEGLPGGWSKYLGGEYDLRGLDRLLFKHGEEDDEIRLTRAELGQRPRLFGGQVLSQDADRWESPLYVGGPPSLYLPLGRQDLRFEEQLGRWRLKLSSIDSTSPTVDSQVRLQEVASAIKQDGQGIVLDLRDDRLLGPSPAGSYRLLVQGPLGLDAEFRLRVWPDLRIEGLRCLYFPGEEEPEEIDFRMRVPQGCLIEKQAGSETTEVSAESTGSSESAGYTVRVHDQEPEAHLELVQVIAGEESARLPLRLHIPRLRWLLEDEADGAEKQGWTTTPVRVPLDPLLTASEDAAVLVDLPPQAREDVRLGMRLWDEQDRLIQEGRAQTSRDPSRRNWRFPLGEFRDTLRQHSSTSFRFGLLLQGVAEKDKETHVLTAVRCTTASDATLERVTEGGTEGWRLRWTETQRVRDQHVRLWHAWQPWKAPLDLAIPENGERELIFTQPRKALGDGRVLAEFYVQDPWVSSDERSETARGCKNPLLVLDLVPPAERLPQIEVLLVHSTSAFELHYEKACILTDMGESRDAHTDLVRCIEHLRPAQPAVALSLWSWLSERGDHELRERLSTALAEPAMAGRMAELRGEGSTSSGLWGRYMEAIRSVGDIPPDTAEILVGVQDYAVWAQAARTLVQVEREPGFAEVLRRVRDHQLAADDALLLLSANSDYSARMLERLWPEPLAVSLLRKLSPSQVIDRGHWVRSQAGWGQVAEIADQDGTPGACFLEGAEKPVLQVVLRKGENGREEQVQIDLQQETITFLKAGSPWFCTKCRSFFSTDPHWISGAHDAAAHEGRGPGVDKMVGAKLAIGHIRFDVRRPRKIWE